METLARVAAAVDGERLWRELETLARFGATPAEGVNRQALSAEEIAARRHLIEQARQRQLAVWADTAGNIFFRLAGREPDLSPVLTGSHIDSQPTGGRFDGAFGVLAGLEALQALAAAPPRRSVVVVVWMNEEASRFAPGMMGSQAFVGQWELSAIRGVRDAQGLSVGECLDRLQATEQDIPLTSPGFPVAAFLEAHIEQGPILEEQGVPVGIVSGIQGTRRYRVRVLGEAAHAGTTPAHRRRDALLAATRIIQGLAALAGQWPDLMFTVGMLRVSPNAPSVVPAESFFSIDIRHPDDALLARLDGEIQHCCEASAPPCTVEVSRIAVAASLNFPTALRARLQRVAKSLGVPTLEIYAGAGHDARHLHAVCPTAMLFAPCRDGVSHAEHEWAEPADLAAATRVLAAALWDLAEAGVAG